MQSTTPGQELMASTLRDRGVNLDAKLTQAIYNRLALDEVFRAPVHIHIVDFLIELISIGKDAVVGRLHVKTEDGTAKRTDPGELIHIVEHNIEGLVTTPRQACHSAVLAVSFGTEVLVDIRNQVVQQHGIERCAVLTLTGCHHHGTVP